MNKLYRAWLAKQKADAVKSKEGGETIEYLTGEIGRLRKLNRMITALKAVSTLVCQCVTDLTKILEN